jgi:hypothetical protein
MSVLNPRCGALKCKPALDPFSCALESSSYTRAQLCSLLVLLCSSATALEPRHRCLISTSIFSQKYPSNPDFPKMLSFLQNPIKRHKTQKGNKISNNIKTKSLTYVN